MARSEARIFTSIWTDPDFRALGVPQKFAYVFLLSQPDLSHCGVLPYRPKRWAQVLPDQSIKEVERSVGGLQSSKPPFVLIDTETGELLIRSMLRRDGMLRSPKMIKPVIGALMEVQSALLRETLALELQRTIDEGVIHPDFVTPRGRHPAEPIDVIIKKLFPQFDTLSDRVSDRVSDTLSQKSRDTHRDRDRDVVKVLTPATSDAVVPVSRATKRETRIPVDFAVTPAMVSWARASCPQVDGRRETEKFINYWTAASGKAAVKRDWPAAWRYWMLNASGRAGQRPVQQPAVGTADERVAGWQALKDEETTRTHEVVQGSIVA